jgi:hypothetical protein
MLSLIMGQMRMMTWWMKITKRKLLVQREKVKRQLRGVGVGDLVVANIAKLLCLNLVTYLKHAKAT